MGQIEKDETDLSHTNKAYNSHSQGIYPSMQMHDIEQQQITSNLTPYSSPGAYPLSNFHGLDNPASRPRDHQISIVPESDKDNKTSFIKARIVFGTLQVILGILCITLNIYTDIHVIKVTRRHDGNFVDWDGIDTFRYSHYEFTYSHYGYVFGILAIISGILGIVAGIIVDKIGIAVSFLVFSLFTTYGSVLLLVVCISLMLELFRPLDGWISTQEIENMPSLFTCSIMIAVPCALILTSFIAFVYCSYCLCKQRRATSNNHGHQHANDTALYVFGRVQLNSAIMLFLLNICLSAAFSHSQVCEKNNCADDGTGYWCGIIAGITGILGIFAGKNVDNFRIAVAYFVFDFFTVVGVINGTLVHLGIRFIDHSQVIVHIIAALTITVSSVLLFTCLIAFVYCCYYCCCKKNG